jgi:threonine dehydratase
VCSTHLYSVWLKTLYACTMIRNPRPSFTAIRHELTQRHVEVRDVRIPQDARAPACISWRRSRGRRGSERQGKLQLTRMTQNHRLSLDSIAASVRTIDPVFLHTPQFTTETLSAKFRCELTLKVETLNPIGSFKGRGADYFVKQISASGPPPPMVCASAGNFGQALAYACRAKELSLTIFASVHANPLKVAKMKGFGATVYLQGEDFDAAKTAAAKWAEERGAFLVEDGRQKEIAEGAGSIGVELLASGKSFDALLIPLGNGALLTGVARWIKACSPATRIIGVCSVHAPAMHDSWKSGRIIETKEARTVADGIAVRVPIPEALQDMNGLVDDVVLVKESSIHTAMKLLIEEERLMVEPAGAVGIAALLEHADLRQYERIGTLLCGSNITHNQIRNLLS